MPDYATIEELFEAFEKLSDADLLALRKAASCRLSGTQFTEPADLIHEALARCLDGRRRWPKDVPFPVFLSNAMKSISTADRNMHGVKRVIQASDLETERRPDPLGHFGARSPSAEDVCISLEDNRLAETLALELEKALKGDAAGLAIMTGWLSGMTAKELMEEQSLTPKEYDAARKRVGRKIAIKAAGKRGRQ